MVFKMYFIMFKENGVKDETSIKTAKSTFKQNPLCVKEVRTCFAGASSLFYSVDIMLDSGFDFYLGY